MGTKKVLDIGDGISEYFKPNNINTVLAKKLWIDVRESIKDFARPLIKNQGYRFYVVNQDRGRCYYRSRVITIPAWVFHRTIQYREWYISHEMAHAYNAAELTNDVHGPFFMEWLKKICPHDAIGFETEYKPRNAASAGISKDGVRKQPIITDDDYL